VLYFYLELTLRMLHFIYLSLHVFHLLANCVKLDEILRAVDLVLEKWVLFEDGYFHQ